MVSDQEPKLRQMSLRDCFAPSSMKTPEKPKRSYKPRGSAGTFGGNRPPKRPHLKDAFMEKRAAHEAALQEKMKERVENIKARTYQQFMKEKLMEPTLGGDGRERMRSVAQLWKEVKAAEMSQAAVLAAENRAVM